MKEKKLPSFVRNPLIYRFFQSKPGRLLSNWILQGMLYMNPVEIAFKLALDIVLTVVIWALLFGQHGLVDWFVSWMLAHTVNWIINCQPVALLRRYIAAAASFGSLSRGRYGDRSDIDMRFVLRGGLLQRLRLAGYCLIERLRAAIHGFPLDLYAFDLDEMQRKMNADEVPVIFYDPDSLIGQSYRESVVFNDFRARFRASVLGENDA